MTHRLPPPPTDQYTALPEARLVATRALLTVRENLADTIAARAMTCIHGGAGLGKTVAVTSCLREVEPEEEIHRITFHARPT
ncbi:ATP-binding protein, partial [Kitasatospora cineracea]